MKKEKKVYTIVANVNISIDIEAETAYEAYVISQNTPIEISNGWSYEEDSYDTQKVLVDGEELDLDFYGI